MLDLMYDIPADESIVGCTITGEVIEGRGAPELRRVSKDVDKEESA